MRQLRAFIRAVGAAGLLCLALFVSPWSPSTQPGGFSLSLDLDDADGDQAVSSLDHLHDEPFSLQLFGTDIQGASGITARLSFDASQVAFEGFDPGDALPNAQAVVQQDSTSITIGVSSLSDSALSGPYIFVRPQPSRTRRSGCWKRS